VHADTATDAERLRRLQGLTDAALGSLELEELLDALLRRTTELLRVDTCAVLLLDEETNELVARAAIGIEEEVEQGVRIPFGGGFAGRVAAEARPIVLENVGRAHVLNPILREKGIESLLGVPLLVRGKVIGVLHVGTLTHRDFTEDDEELLLLAAERVAIAIEHVRLFDAERAARTRVEHVQAVTDAALQHLEVTELLAVLLPRIRTILAADTCAVLLLDEKKNELVARAAVGIEEEVEQGVRIPVGGGFAGRVAAERRPVILDDVDHAHVLNPILRQKGIKSLLGVPLMVRGEVIGVLHVGTLTPRKFNRDDVELLQLVADRVAVAVDRARLHDEALALDELKSNFVAIASHELRTPAASVYGVLATLAERTGLDPETRETLIQVGYEQAERMRRLIEQLLDLSQLDARRMATNPKPIELHTLLSEIASATVPQGTTVHLDMPLELTVVADPVMIERVVSNLLVNAVRYGSPPITIAVDEQEGRVRIAVEDSGEGVPEALEPHIFERFARGEDAPGSGLGLTIARAYSHAHGGELIYRRGEAGARFELTFRDEASSDFRAHLRSTSRSSV
jgi:signal transduction histidine kinase